MQWPGPRRRAIMSAQQHAQHDHTFPQETGPAHHGTYTHATPNIFQACHVMCIHATRWQRVNCVCISIWFILRPQNKPPWPSLTYKSDFNDSDLDAKTCLRKHILVSCTPLHHYSEWEKVRIWITLQGPSTQCFY